SCNFTPPGRAVAFPPRGPRDVGIGIKTPSRPQRLGYPLRLPHLPCSARVRRQCAQMTSRVLRLLLPTTSAGLCARDVRYATRRCKIGE
ncbi:unnamed protein product, partial [Ascophyllum nodosum]